MSEKRSAPVFLLIAGLLSSVPLCGCADRLGTGGTGEMVVPAPTLRQVDEMDLREHVATTRPSEPPPKPPAESAVSIEACRRMALANNLDLRVDFYNPSISREALTNAEAQFEAVFSTTLSGSSVKSPATPSSVNARLDTVTVSPGLNIPLRTGGSIQLNLPVDVTHNHSEFVDPGTFWSINPNVAISQPLLRGGGLYVNTQGIRIAFYEYQRVQAQTKLQVISVLTDVDRAYWQLYAAREALKVRKKEHDSAVAQLERARRQARAGVAAEVDVVRAESGVADTVESIILSENSVRLNQRTLKRILNDPAYPLDAPTIIVPSTEPSAFPYQLDVERLTNVALQQRMEMLQLEIQIAEQTSTVKVSRNSLLPVLSLQYVYGVSGLGNTAGQAFSQAYNDRPDSHSLSLQFQAPIGNEAARSQLRQALLQRMQLLESKEQQALLIRQDIGNAVDTLNTDLQRIIAAHERVVLSSRTLDVEVRQFNLGLRTSTDVLIAQTNLADAQLAEVSAVSDYQIAQVDIAFATGTVLGASHVDWQPAKSPNVPRY